MQNKIIMITGSTSGIGLGIAKKFAKEGGTVIINGFADSSEVKNIVSDLTNLGAKKVFYARADLTKPEQIDEMFQDVLARYRKIDILVNNAGVQFVSPIENFPAEKWELIIKLDLVAAFYTIKNVIPLMKEQNWGRIINIASAHALVASPFKSAYVAAKHGILGMTKTVALEVAQHGITVNALCPGYVNTPLVQSQIADTAKLKNLSQEDVIKNIILGAQATKKFVEIEEIADFTYFLSTDSAASITGAALTIDGGWTAS